MPQLDVMDETFVRAPAAELAAALTDESAWARFGLDLTCYEDRGVEGRRWTLGGPLTGTAEVWLEQVRDGVIVHLYLRGDPVRPIRWPRRPYKVLHRRHFHPLKAWVLSVKREHDMARPAGTPGTSRIEPRTDV